jgi:peptidoglycan/xylan/chitin deacetylase (PgdA/CDA1 family)
MFFIKRLLQKVLPQPSRAAILDDMFHRFVAVEEYTLANELYLTIEQLRTMVRCGMYVGSHSYEHSWMDTLSPGEQQCEIERSLEFLSAVGAPTADWVMCYPYGATNDSLVAILERRQCAFGLTTEVGRAPDLRSNPYRLPRMDTNDFPKSS